MSNIVFEDKGFINEAKINIIRRNEIYTYMAENDLNVIDDSSELNFCNINFNIEIGDNLYSDLDTIYGQSIESNLKILRCKDNGSVIKLYILEYQKNKQTPEISMYDEVWFYTNYNDKLGDEAIKMIDKPFYCIMWENDIYADVVLGYMMEDGKKKMTINGSNDYSYSPNDTVRLTFMNNTKFSILFSNVRKIIKNMVTLHKKGIYHLDIKPENITNDFRFMDFGCTVDIDKFYQILTDLYSGKINQIRLGTCGFQAPELIMFKTFYKELPPIEDMPLILSQMDIFSLGCCIFYILFGISFYEDFIGTGTIKITANRGLELYNEIFNDPDNKKIDTMQIYRDYFDDDGIYTKLMEQLNERYSSLSPSVDVDIDLYEWMIKLNPHERVDIETLNKFV